MSSQQGDTLSAFFGLNNLIDYVIGHCPPKPALRERSWKIAVPDRSADRNANGRTSGEDRCRLCQLCKRSCSDKDSVRPQQKFLAFPHGRPKFQALGQFNGRFPGNLACPEKMDVLFANLISRTIEQADEFVTRQMMRKLSDRLSEWERDGRRWCREAMIEVKVLCLTKRMRQIVTLLGKQLPVEVVAKGNIESVKYVGIFDMGFFGCSLQGLGALEFAAIEDQIGRASCRERV